MRLPAGLAVLIVASLPGCELATHALDFRVGPSPADALCTACDDGGRLPPCPASDTSPAQGHTFVFAARRSRMGPVPVPGPTPRFDLGLDLDCSLREPSGLPVLCAPRTTSGWQPLPGGVDDALLARVLAPVYAASPPGRAVDLDAAISGAFERGVYGVVVSVDDWSGLPDDPSIEVSVRTSPGLAGGAAPAWSGGDRWQPYPDVDADGERPFAVPRVPGYVSAGTLVADARALGAVPFRFGPEGAHFGLILRGLSFSGGLTPTALAGFTMTGVIDQPSAGAAAEALAGALGTCAGGAAGVFLGALSEQIAVAADMPFAPTGARGDPCDGISFAWALDAQPALVAPGPGAPSAPAPLCP